MPLICHEIESSHPAASYGEPRLTMAWDLQGSSSMGPSSMGSSSMGPSGSWKTFSVGGVKLRRWVLMTSVTGAHNLKRRVN